MAESALRVLNVFLRLASAGSRFVLLLVLARLLSPAEVGHYGLFLATVILGIAFMGAEFYAFGNRELLRLGRERWSFVVQHCLLAWSLVYLLMAPALLLVAPLWRQEGISPWWLPAILVVEHLCQESNRLLIAMGRPLTASSLMFLRMGAWVWVLLPWMWLDPASRRLDAVFLAWFCGAALSLLVAIALIRREIGPWRRWPTDWRWLRRGAGIGLLYLASSFAYRGMFAVDRYFVQHLVGAEQLGVYVLYIGLATAIITVIEPAILAFLNPRLVASWQTGDLASYRRIFRELRWSVLALSTLLALAIALLAPWLLAWTGKSAYLQDLDLLWLLLLMVWVCANGSALDSALYARGQDRALTGATVATFALFLALVPALAALDRGLAVATALLLAFAASYALRLYLLRRAPATPLDGPPLAHDAVA